MKTTRAETHRRIPPNQQLERPFGRPLVRTGCVLDRERRGTPGADIGTVPATGVTDPGGDRSVNEQPHGSANQGFALPPDPSNALPRTTSGSSAPPNTEPPQALSDHTPLSRPRNTSAASASPPDTASAYTFNVVDARAWASLPDTTAIDTPASSIWVAMKCRRS